MSAAYELVIWDFDGTIADTRTAIVEAATHAMVSGGYDAPDPRSITALVGLPINELYSSLAADPGEAVVSKLTEAHRSHFEQNAAAVSTVFTGIEDLLSDITSAGARSAIATSRTRRTLGPLMEHLGIAWHFVAVRTDDTVATPKPAPDMVLELCTELGVDPSTTLVVGDTAFDIEMGNRAGTTTCGVTWGNHGRDELEAARCDHVASSVPELRVLIGEDRSVSDR